MLMPAEFSVTGWRAHILFGAMYVIGAMIVIWLVATLILGTGPHYSADALGLSG